MLHLQHLLATVVVLCGRRTQPTSLGQLVHKQKGTSRTTAVDLLAELKALQIFSMSTNPVYLPFKQIAITILLIIPTFYHQTLAALNLQPEKIPS